MGSEMISFVKLRFEGIAEDWSNLGDFEIASPNIDYLSFSDMNTVLFHIKDSGQVLNAVENKSYYIDECKKILLKFYVQLIKIGRYFDRFEINDRDVQVKINNSAFIGITDGITVSDSVSVVCQKSSTGRIKSQEEIEQEQQKLCHDTIQKIFYDSVENSKYITNDRSKIFFKLFQVNDPVLKFFISYSWLIELCGSQDNAEVFIEQSSVYKNLSGISKRGARYDTRKKKDVETDRFTYNRNLIGHSINDALAISDQTIIGETITLNNPLIKIILEKLDTPNKLEMHTVDLAKKNFKKLSTLFPNAVTETINEDGKVVRAIDADVLRQEISAEVVEGPQERYQFTWPDKKKSVVLANAPIAKTLRLDRAKSVGRDGIPGSIDTENIYIEGDNLDALKLLRETYLGKVKMIYIDPPYNTGSDFIYEDDFSQATGDYMPGSGQFDEDGNRLVQNTESNGRFHTDWLNMLYPRLRIAKDYLADDGVILISIDAGEMENLWKIANEVFGENNFICCFVWNTKKAAQGMTTAHMIVDNQEYILVYTKNANSFKFRGLDRDENNGFSNPDHDPRGPWKRQYLQRLGQGLPIRTIVDPKTGIAFSFETPYAQEKLNNWIKEGRIIFPIDPTKYPARKEFLGEYENRQQLVSALGLYATKSTTEKLYNLFDEIKVFTNPKPDTLLKFLVQQITNNGIILDFFSGSATTAHAVMQLNAEDGGSRKFIMVQLPEVCGENSEARKAGYSTICDIGEERIRRAGDKIRAETGADIDYGFRVFRVDSTNMEDVYYTPAETKQDQLDFLAENIKPDRTPEDLLFQVMLDLGVLLSSSIEETVIAGKKVFSVADGYLLACFDKNVTEETVTEIAKRRPFYAVFRDSSMATDSVAANFEQIFETYSPKTVRKVL